MQENEKRNEKIETTKALTPSANTSRSFEFTLWYTLRNEIGENPKRPGGFVAHPKDPGGATKWGVSSKFLSKLFGYEVTPTEVENLSYQDAKYIYFEYFWKDTNICRIDRSPIDTAIFDMAVLFGSPVATRNAQYALRNSGFLEVNPDFILGPITIGALRKVAVPSFMLNYRALMKLHARRVVQNLNVDMFENGWLNRIERLKTLEGDMPENV